MSRGEATQRYWQRAITDLQPYRFYFVENVDESVSEYYQRTHARLRAEIGEFRDFDIQSVDPDLIAMSQRLLIHDRQVLLAFEALREYARNHGMPEDEAAIGQRMMQSEQVLADVVSNPALLQKLDDPKLREPIQLIVESDLSQGERYQEILVMQARLQERYPVFSFPLPEPPQ